VIQVYIIGMTEQHQSHSAVRGKPSLLQALQQKGFALKHSLACHSHQDAGAGRAARVTLPEHTSMQVQSLQKRKLAARAPAKRAVAPPGDIAKVRKTYISRKAALDWMQDALLMRRDADIVM
jgi:hypothetical protein